MIKKTWEYGLFLLVLILFYEQDVTSLWKSVLLVLVGADLIRRVVQKENPFPMSVWLWILAGWNSLLIVSTIFQAPESLHELVRHLLLPSLVVPLFIRIFSTEIGVARLLRTLALAGIFLLALNLVQYVGEYRSLGHFSGDIPLHRRYGDGLIFLLPFIFLRAVEVGHVWIRMVWLALVFLGLVMLILTGMRGAWLGFGVALGAAALIAWPIVSARFRYGTLIALPLLVASVIHYAPDSLVKDKIAAGMNTSHRTTGTWGPSIEMIKERPLTGFGFGDGEFHREFNTRAPTHPHWTIQNSLGAHSSYLSTAFAGGLGAMFLYALLVVGPLAAIYRRVWHGIRQGGDRGRALQGLAIASALLASYGVHAMTESKSWEPFVIILAIALTWLAAREPIHGHGMPTS